MANSSLMDTLFQRTLEDLIKGIRLQLINGSSFISKSIEEIRREIKSTDLQTKSIALQKLTYLSSIHGVDMSWASFHVVEVMSSPKFSQKKIGYHAASISFNESTSVILLITNQLRKDLTSVNEFEVSLALECISQICTVDLARDLTPEVFTLLGSSKVMVRKKATGVLLRVFGKYTDAVKVCFKRLVENLESSDPQIVSAAVGVFCELVEKDPRSYLPLAPEFYRILVDSKNNWVLIKVLKIFAKLAPLEPRLGKRIVEPICEHMRRTGAVSLLFECIKTVVSSLAEFEPAVKLAVEKNRDLLMNDDPNLKSLGLRTLSIIASKHLWAVLENKEIVVKSLSDTDPSIKLESLRLLMVMVSENNLAEICRVLVNYALKSDLEFCNEILGSILSTCSRNVYETVVDFEWYVSLLGEMSRIPHCQKGEDIEKQLVDIGMRVKDVRPQLVRVCRDLLIDPALLGNPFIYRILSAAAWVSGEYVKFSKDPFELLESLLQPRTRLLPPSIRAIYIQSCFKVVVFCLHSYFLHNHDVVSSIRPYNLVPRVSSSLSKGENPEGSVVTGETSLAHEQDDGLSTGFFSQLHESFSAGNDRDAAITNCQSDTSLSGSIVDVCFSHDRIFNMLSVAELTFGPLSGSHEVEVQERAQNVLGLINLVKLQVLGCSDQVGAEEEEPEAFEIAQLISNAFSEELGPVSMSAQEKVPVPDRLILSDNLNELEAICGDIQLPSLRSPSHRNPLYEESIGDPYINSESKEQSELSSGSTSLLAEHRKRHGLYYLSSEKNEMGSSDYPPANDLTLQSKVDDSEDLLKLTAESLVPKKKSSHAKPRPVVVKLDEGEDRYTSTKKPEPKGDLLSDAVRDVLLGNEAGTSSLQSNALDKLSSRNKGKDKQNSHGPLKSKESLGDEDKIDRKHHSRGKGKRHKNSGKTYEGNEENGSKERKRNSRRHRRHMAGETKDEPLNNISKSPVIPDFLL